MFDWDLLMRLTKEIPENLNRGAKKELIGKEIRRHVYLRDKKTCQICRKKGEYGNPQYGIAGILSIHHIIPNGVGELNTLITLCEKCHAVVHLLLYIEGKWRYVPR